MFCQKCGREIGEASKFCKYCGACILEKNTEKVMDFKGLDTSSFDVRQEVVNGFENNETEKNANINERTGTSFTNVEIKGKLSFATKIALMFALVFFFCPFVMLSCGGETVDISGFEFMIAQDLSGERVVEEEPANVFLAVAFLAGVFGLMASSEKKASSVLIVIALSMLILFRITFFQYYEVGEYKNSGMIEFQWGWMLCTGA